MKHDIAFVSLEVWDDVWRRNQFLCAGLARRNLDRTILFVTPPRDLSHALRKGRWRELRPRPDWSPPGLPNVVVTTPAKLLPNSLAAGRAANGRLLRRHVRGEMRRLRIKRPTLWINDHATGHLVGRLGEVGVVYDITDDWTAFDGPAALRERTRRQDAELCRDADATIVCSQRLYDLKTTLVPDAARLHLIPNGVDAAHYAGVLDGDAGPPPDGAEQWQRPVLGYVGTVHPERVDVSLVETIARRLGELGRGSVVLVGPDHLRPEQRKRLADTGRVHLVGPVAYADVPRHMARFDVLVTPHVVSDFTESLNPIKLWEYLAAGRPVVSTDVAGFRDYPRHVRIAGDAASFVAAALASLDEPREAAEARRAEAARHSWDERLDCVEAVLNAIGGSE